jgi:hypothetical protein
MPTSRQARKYSWSDPGAGHHADLLDQGADAVVEAQAGHGKEAGYFQVTFGAKSPLLYRFQAVIGDDIILVDTCIDSL